MKPWWIAIVVLAAARPAAADEPPTGAARCTRGVELAAGGDLPRAALYLEGCDKLALAPELADTVARARADVAHELDASKLSALSIVTMPEGLVAETDAMPGERFTTPATIWARAGEYKVNVAIDAATLEAGKGQTTTATLDAFSRRTVIINLPVNKPTSKAGKVDFSEDTLEQTAHSGPPPAVKHGTMMPEKYRRPTASGGPQLDDPFAQHGASTLAWRIGARIGGGMYLHDGADPGAAVQVAAIAQRPLDGPLALATRAGWTRRDIDAAALDVGLAARLVHTSSLALSLGAALRGEVRVQGELAMQPVARVGIGAAAELELALRSLPFALGVRFEPSFTELVPGARNHNVLLEVGYDWR